jgi:hypothetical protein
MSRVASPEEELAGSAADIQQRARKFARQESELVGAGNTAAARMVNFVP